MIVVMVTPDELAVILDQYEAVCLAAGIEPRPRDEAAALVAAILDPDPPEIH